MSNLDPVVQIGDWYYQVIYGQLWPVSAPTDNEQMVRLEPRLHSLLNFFLLHPNKLLAKDTLIEKVWPVEEGTDAAVMRAVGALRKVLGDDVRAPTYIATVSKKGYCWLADIKASKLMVAEANEPIDSKDTVAVDSDYIATTPHWSWRAIALTALVVIICCASLAYVLAKYTAVPLVKLPDTIAPISALSGQEYWPVLNVEQSHAVYQHKAPDESALHWSVQRLADLRVEHMPQQYVELSQALWLDSQHIIFRGRDIEEECHFYRQRILPVPEKPALLWPCHSVLPQGIAAWQQKWLWLDTNATNKDLQLWSAEINEPKVQLATIPFYYRKLEYMLQRDDSIYLLAQETHNNSVLLQLSLPDGQPEPLAQFPFLLEHMSWWDKSQLLLSPVEQGLQIYDLRNSNIQSLGPLTRELTQAARYSDQVLATQFLDFTTDILQWLPGNETEKLRPWHVSNRSERLVAVSPQHTAFVSERAGHSQIWLADGANSTQLTRLTNQQQVQQLLWHNNDLLILLNGQLHRLQVDTTELSLHPLQANKPGRYASCNTRLYWTELTERGWVLFSAQNYTSQQVLAGVVDVRCAPDNSLLLQFAEDTALSLLSATGQLQQLPVSIDWRKQDAEQWFVDDSGIYWLASDNNSVHSYVWQTAQHNTVALPTGQQAIAIYSSGNGLGYIVRPRPHDTDIVWLQNRR
ncbi:winged helix-turn-helix domain-containing protein [Rheinheimera maricola]|uniref:Winged helix-turn-helix domain-containing protein n=1 Tax=Rheinheimera maricola TaxID=2793282 RepID=A0ABS7X7J5_9GAMM|nr:winged helix-turn-helix domain-containing protein [Rheinheimera maricola]MBZ9611135.1 winged helix-turn-helix domain-containing protein [Rheinheimera maricola]